MPSSYNRMIVNQIFYDMGDMDFFNLAQTIYGYRLYTDKSLNSLNVDGVRDISLIPNDFNKIVGVLPKRL